MDLLLKELDERYYYGECLNNGSLCAIEKVKELMNYKNNLNELLEAINIEEEKFRNLNTNKASDIYVKGYLFELNYIKIRITELNVA
ncbi:hypothetical protein [Clostridium massiliamazoniense]|uniref:hypothetical protein n=1 Tax=Clostridium massiliamazoniense TaxID=1347366 RepID=UPI0006D763A7|nr:hypothetical protein [Clostridium massiliamazoniense]